MPSVAEFLSQFKITEGRLVNTIHETSEAFGAAGRWGSDPSETGVRRLALSDEDKGVRDWYVNELKSLGCEVRIDEVGNIFGIYPGKNEGAPTALGSHLDTQPTGGRYDGILGVLASLEVLRTFKDTGFVPNYPVASVCWMNEEGARWPASLMGSSVWAGLMTKEEVYASKSILDQKPVTVKAELERIGYLGPLKASYKTNPLYAHFELHIEQGPIMEKADMEIGIVEGVQAYTWWNVYVDGTSSHTGTTPLDARNDAMLTASKMIVKAYDVAERNGGLTSIGTLNVTPASINVIPERIHFTLDGRHHQDEGLSKIVDQCKEEFEKIANTPNGISHKHGSVKFEHILTSDAVHYDKKCIQTVTDSVTELFGKDKCMRITSGAGHDSCSTSAVIPTSMIFIPCRDGISHNFTEYSTPQQVDNGFRALLATVTRYDLMRAAGEA